MDENSNVDLEDLDAFNDLLSGKTPKVETPPVEEPKEDTPGQDTPAIDEDEKELVDNPEEDKSTLKVGKPKLTAKERIEQLNAKYRETERLLEQERQARLEAETKAKQAPVKEDAPPGAPNPDSVDEKGDPLYPLGEYDPKYQADLIEFYVSHRFEEFTRTEQQKKEEETRKASQKELQEDWANRLNEAEVRLPDLRTKGAALEEVFQTVPGQFAEYLATTIMTLSNGPEVLYYLADNVDEARRIVNSDPVSATIALGRLDAMSTPTKTETKKVTEAPPPPVHTRGSSGKFTVSPDTDDLEAFSEAYFPKRK